MYDGKQSAMNFYLNYIQLKLYSISFLKVNYVLQAVKQLTTFRLEDNGQCCARLSALSRLFGQVEKKHAWSTGSYGLAVRGANWHADG